MAWSGFIVALVLAYLLQSFAEALFPGTYFDAYLLLALLCGFVAPADDARIGGWIVGLTKDLASADPLGIHALTLGLATLLVTGLREAININAAWVRVLAAFIAAVPARFVYLLHAQYWVGTSDESLVALLTHAALSAAIAAVLVAVVAAAPAFLSSSRSSLRRRRYGAAS